MPLYMFCEFLITSSGLTELLYCHREMPSTYEGKWGTISYTLEARLTQSIWCVNKAKTEFPFVTKSEFPFGSKAEMIIIGLKVAKGFFDQRILFLSFCLKHYSACVCVCWCRRSNLPPRHHSLALQRLQWVLPQKKWLWVKVIKFRQWF